MTTKISDPPAPNDDPLIEEVARAMCSAAGLEPDQLVKNANGGVSMRWKGYIIPAKQFIAGWRVMARRASR